MRPLPACRDLRLPCRDAEFALAGACPPSHLISLVAARTREGAGCLFPECDVISFRLIRLLRRPRHLRRIAASTAPTTRLYLPGRRHAATRSQVVMPSALPPGFRPTAKAAARLALPDDDERTVQVLLQTLIDGRPTALPTEVRDG